MIEHTSVGVVHDLGLVNLAMGVEHVFELLQGDAARETRHVQVVALVLLSGLTDISASSFLTETANNHKAQERRWTYPPPPPRPRRSSPPPFLAGDLERSRRTGDLSRSSRPPSRRGERSRSRSRESSLLPCQTDGRQSSVVVVDDDDMLYVVPRRYNCVGRCEGRGQRGKEA